MILNSPGRALRSAGSTKGKLREVKSGIFLSAPLGERLIRGKPKKLPKAPIIRTKSGSLRKITSKDVFAALEEEEQEDTTGTRVTSRFARVLLAGSGFLADAYDLFVINLVLRLLRNEYPEYSDAAGVNIRALEGSVAAAALVGAIIGQLVAGSLADVIGRKKIFVTTAVLISIGSFGSAMCGNSAAFTVYSQLACWRFCLGIGVGGEYPLAATVTSESTSAAHRGSLMAGVFSMQGVGSLLSVIVVMTCLSIGLSDGFTWRFALAFGAVPVMCAFPFRLRMHETETFTRVEEARKTNQAEAAKHQHQHSHPHAHGHPTPSTPLGVRSPAGYGSTEVHNNLFADEYAHGRTTASTKGTIQSQNGQNGFGLRGEHHHGADSGELEMRMVTDSVFSGAYDYSTKTGPGEGDSGRAAGADLWLINPSNMSSKSGKFHGHHGSHSMSVESAGVAAEREHPSRVNELRKAFVYYKWHILGTALSWFLLDVDFYANGLFNQKITSTIFSVPGQQNSALQDAYYAGILSLIGIPGYYLSVYYIEAVGRKRLQMLGFAMMALLFCTCSVFYRWLMDPAGGSLRKYAFLLIYALTFLFSNFGPNTTSFVIPGEIFPAEVRATCHGISAACGKLGAATGAFLFPLLLGPQGANHPTEEGIQTTMFLCSLIAALGVLVTYLFIPTYDVSTLTHEGTYMVLDHACLQPNDADMMLLDGYELVQDDGEEDEEEGSGKYRP